MSHGPTPSNGLSGGILCASEQGPYLARGPLSHAVIINAIHVYQRKRDTKVEISSTGWRRAIPVHRLQEDVLNGQILHIMLRPLLYCCAVVDRIAYQAEWG